MRALALVALVAAQATIIYQDIAHDLTLSGTGIQNLEGESTAGAKYKFKASGQSVKLESLAQGSTLSAPQMNGIFSPAKDKGKAFVETLHAEGGVVGTFDSHAAYQGSIAEAKRLNKPVPAEPRQFDLADLKTQSFDYTGNETDGTFTIPGAFTLTDNAKGKIEPKKQGDPVREFTQTMTVDGSSATIDLNPTAPKKKMLKTGSIQGPIVLHILRTETTAGAKEEVTKLAGQADKMEFDLVTSRTITLTGHVKLNGESGVLIGSTTGEVATIFLDEENQPVKIQIEGAPASSRVREKKKDGGNV